LIPKHISLQTELNEWEQTNILDAEEWCFKQKHPDLLSAAFIQKLHRKMFNNTWKWAGEFRKTLKNIGVPSYEIQSELLKLCADVKFQIDHKSDAIDKVAAHLHHRLVWIHPFPNGNGRHARIYTDIFLLSLQNEKFTWGSGSIASSNQIRKAYIEALRAADQQNFDSLLAFVRS